MTTRHRVVIVGGGFGGLAAAKALRRAPVDVTVIDRQSHHLFQPLLYQVATGVLSQGNVAPPLRDVLRHQRNVEVVLAEVDEIDLDRRAVRCRLLDRTWEIPYDSLIVATGSAQSYFGHDDFALHAPGMKTIDDALEVRGRLFGAFELAELEGDASRRAAWMTFVVVGAGPTGVEMAGQIAELSRYSLRSNYRRIETAAARIVLVDAAPRILSSFDERLARRAAAVAVTAARRSPKLEGAASAAAALLFVDAWFDVLTSSTRAELIAALVEAVFIEIPFAVLCLRLARLRVGGAGWANSSRRDPDLHDPNSYGWPPASSSLS